MEETPDGTPVGVDDPYEHAGPCDHLTGDGRCRYALEYAGHDPEFAAERRADDYECLVADEDADWPDCPHYRSTTDGKRCARCGLEEVRMAHEAARPLVEEHHLSYGNAGGRGGRRPADTDRRQMDRGRARDGVPDDRPAGRSDDGPVGTGHPDSSGGRSDIPDERGTTDVHPGGSVDGSASVEEGVPDGDAPGRADSERDDTNDAGDAPSHEITIGLCRWCHAKVHKGFARVDDDANPDPDAIAERESRRGTEMGEFGFSTARERRRDE